MNLGFSKTKGLIDLKVVFLDFFKSRGYLNYSYGNGILPPSRSNDLLFVNAGIVTLSQLISETREGAYVSIQKCLRIAGKHNDLDTIGKSTRHHTLFEMGGHFIWGMDVFKGLLDAVDFLRLLGFKDVDLSLTYHPEHEGIRRWLEENLPGFELRIDESNQWSSGKIGHLGYCVEIYKGDLELWNLVFVDREILDDERVASLKKPYLDTGVGLSRLLSVLRGNLDTYLNEDISPCVNFFEGKIGSNSSARVIADHLRTSLEMISNEILPGPQGRGYVLRKLIRRLAWFLLEVDESFSQETFEDWAKPKSWNFDFKTNELPVDEIFFKEFNSARKLWNSSKKLLAKQSPEEIQSVENLRRLHQERGLPLPLLRRHLLALNLDKRWNDFLQSMKDQD